MKSYQYQIIRYIHDHFTGEYVNVGVVVYSPENHFLKSKITRKYQRITSMFADANGKWVQKVLRDFEDQLALQSKRLTDLFQPSQKIEYVTGSIIPNDDTAIRLSPPQFGIDVHLDSALEDLFQSMVEKHINDSRRDTLLDEDVWRERYKQYFEKYEIINNLKEHKIKISDHPDDVISFSKAWKNDIWHCYEPLSFVVKKRDTVKNKIQKWSGRLSGLRRSGVALHLTLMVSYSEKHRRMLPLAEEYLVKEYNIPENKIRVEIVTEDQAEILAKEVVKMMQDHTN